MASAKKKGNKNSKAKKKTAKGTASSLKDTAAGFLDEVEKHGSALAGDVRQLFDTLSEKVSGLASSAAETTVAVAEKVTVKEPAELIRGLLEGRLALVDHVLPDPALGGEYGPLRIGLAQLLIQRLQLVLLPL